MASYFRIRNFERFQHYKDRNPPWIRLYGALWRDRAFFRLPDAVKAHLIGLFALAARLDNRIPDDPEWLAHELCASEPIDLAALVASGFLIPEHQASAMAAARELPATASVSVSDSHSDSDAIGEEMDPGNRDRRQGGPSPSEATNDPELSGAAATSYFAEPQDQEHLHRRRKSKRPETRWPAGFTLDEQMRRFAAEFVIDPEAEFEAWRDDCAAHDRRYSDWHAAWRGRCRNALRFASRSGARPRASPAESAMDVALRRLREASEREQSGRAS
jgi:hypothetical protein